MAAQANAFGIIFASMQLKTNAAWGSLIQDARVAIQIDRFDNWMDPRHLGYPMNESGEIREVDGRGISAFVKSTKAIHFYDSLVVFEKSPQVKKIVEFR